MMKSVLAAFAALQLVTGALLWLVPGFFYDVIGPFGPRNDHYMGDLATWYLTLGAFVLVAVRRPALVLLSGLLVMTLNEAGTRAS
jgi:hypothetical protein